MRGKYKHEDHRGYREEDLESGGCTLALSDILLSFTPIMLLLLGAGLVVAVELMYCGVVPVLLEPRVRGRERGGGAARGEISATVIDSLNVITMVSVQPTRWMQ